jgi:hypothetical protein
MPSNTGYDPANIKEFEKSKLNKDAKGIQVIIPAGTNRNIDLLLTDDVLMAGGTIFLAKGAVAGDKVDFQIVHPVYGVVNQFITDWYLNPDSTSQEIPNANYPAKLFAGLTMRVVYHSVGSTDVWVAINYNKEKVLV